MNIRKFVAVLALLAAPATVRADGVSFTQISATQVVSSFESFDASGCKATKVVVLAAKGSLRDASGHLRSQLGTLSVSRINHCTGVSLLNAFGDTFSGVNLSVVDAPPLNSASLSMTVPSFDLTGGRIINFSVNMRWSGTGQLQVGAGSSHMGGGGSIMTITHFIGSSRQASASGIVSDGIDFTPGASITAEIDRSTNGEITIQNLGSSKFCIASGADAAIGPCR